MECCLEIEKYREYSSDMFLVFQVRFQNLADTTALSFPHDGVDYWSEPGSDTINMLVKSFQSGMESFILSQDPELVQSRKHHCHFTFS
jgi:hypothetical protein